MLIIDAYNVLNVQGVLPPHLAAPELLDLVRLLKTSRYRNESTVLVCDGPLASQTRPNQAIAASGRTTSISLDSVRLVFSRPGQEADDLIEELLLHHQGSSSVTMVSSDRRLIRSARKWGGRPLQASTFLRHLAADHDRTRRPELPAFAQSTPLNRSDLAYWMKHFGLGAPVDHPPSPPPPPPPIPTPEPAKTHKPAQPSPMLDPSLPPLIKESGLDIDLAELDMHRWLSDIQPFPPPSS